MTAGGRWFALPAVTLTNCSAHRTMSWPQRTKPSVNNVSTTSAWKKSRNVMVDYYEPLHAGPSHDV